MNKKKKSLKIKNKHIPWLYTAIFFAVLALDQITKYFAETMKESIALIPGLLNLNFVTNTGIAFGFFKGNNTSMIFIYFMVLGLLIFFYDSFETRTQKICYTLILAGLAGNLLDRFMHGFVTDFLDLGWWPVFNIADSAVFISVIILVVIALFSKKN